MYSENFAKNLNYKLRELELIIKQLESDAKPAKIDIDLALEKTRDLYNILLKINDSLYEKTKKESPQIPHGKPVVPSDPELVEDEGVFEAEGIIPEHPEKKEQDSPSQKSKKEPEKHKYDPGRTRESAKENTSEDYKKDSKPGKTEDPVIEKEKEQNGPQDIEIVADRYQSSQNYINQAMANKQTKKDLTSRMQSKPISDLRNSIGLNEKFLFIKELFKGRPEKYNQCIEALNQTSSYEEALSLIKNNYSWEEDNEIVEKLLSLVRRKHKVQ